MICILEPKTDQALSGTFLYNKELAAASHGKIERISLSKQDMDSFIQGDILLIDSAWLYSAPAKALAKSEGNGWLVHSLPEKVEDWKKTFGESTHLVASSASVADRLKAEMPDHKVITLLPAVDTRIRSLQPQEREHDLLRLITVANVMPRKGLKEAAVFLKKLEDEEGLAFHWYVVGQPMPDREYNGSPEIDEAYVDEFTSLIDLYEWHDDVTLVGSFTMEQQIRMYLNMDVAFFPSLKEDFGKVLLETAQLGLPILTTDVGIAQALFGSEDHALILPAPLGEASIPEAAAFLRNYQGLEINVRKKRNHALLSRSWTIAADELIKALRVIN